MVTRTTVEDLHIGKRLKLARIAANKSQGELSGEVGLTFQQIQKYEKGLNRISASRLHEFAKILGVSIDFFFRRDDMFSSDAAMAENAMQFFDHQSHCLKQNNEKLIASSPVKASAQRGRKPKILNSKEESSNFDEEAMIELFRSLKTKETKEKVLDFLKFILDK